MIDLKYKTVTPDAMEPVYATNGSACFDFFALEDGRIHAFQTKTFRTGLSFEVPDGFVLLMYSRSGMGFKHNVRFCNCVGVIDSDYRGEVQVGLTNDSDTVYEVKKGDRIAQGMLVEIPRVNLIHSEQLSETERGTGGFGSTGS